MNTTMTRDEFCSQLPADLRRLAAEHDVPGASVAVLIDGQVIEAATGVINTRTGEPVTPDTLFMIQSITKTLTATLIMQLVDEGAVAVDDLVIDHLPGFRTADPEAGATITVRHLLTHTGGFEGDLWAATTSGPDALQRFVNDLVAQAPQISPPGEQFSYCNAGFGTLGRIVEVRRGMTYEQALRRFVLEPLGVDEVAFTADEALAFRTAIGHLPTAPDSALRPLFNWAVMPPSNPAAGNQLAMSARGLLAFARMHVADGRASDGAPVLSVASARRMREAAVAHPASHGADSFHGLGWWLERGALVEHGGGSTGVAAMLRMAPRQGVSAVVLTNGEGGNAMIEELLDPLFKDLPGVAPSAGPSTPSAEDRVADPRPYLGRFESRVAAFDLDQDDEGRLWQIRTPQRESLEMSDRAGTVVGTRPQRHELRPIGHDRFVIIDADRSAGELEFLQRRADGRARLLYSSGRAVPRVDEQADTEPTLSSTERR